MNHNLLKEVTFFEDEKLFVNRVTKGVDTDALLCERLDIISQRPRDRLIFHLFDDKQ